ncbi:Lrp/AsnC family transcriptional regulator [Candidatus Woesearchaeota archaeon]|nr:Lrp/AsnC family transcriptional regulator [Candidatus Woesearchaeota archaeon]
MELDAIDKKIINSLLDNAKLPLRDIAKTLKVSFVTVMHRIKKLEKEGIIKQYTALIDYDKIGYGVHVLIEVRITKGKLLELEKKLATLPNVYAVYDTTGDFDTSIIGRFNSTRQMDNFLKKIQTFDFVERTNTKLILNTMKENSMKV